MIAIVGIGDNPILAKIALDNEAKHNKGFLAEGTYQNVLEKIYFLVNIV